MFYLLHYLRLSTLLKCMGEIQIPFLRIWHLISFQISMEGSLSGVNGLSARRHVVGEPINVLGLAPIHLQKINLAVNRSTLVPLKKPKTATPRTVVRPEFAFIII